jgi:hypothetical protein
MRDSLEWDIAGFQVEILAAPTQYHTRVRAESAVSFTVRSAGQEILFLWDTEKIECFAAGPLKILYGLWSKKQAALCADVLRQTSPAYFVYNTTDSRLSSEMSACAQKYGARYINPAVNGYAPLRFAE